MLLLSDRDVMRSVSNRDALRALERVYRCQGGAGATLPGRLALFFSGDNYLRVLGAAVPGVNAFGFKAFHRVDNTVRYVVHIMDMDDGKLLAVMDANYLTVLRTAATAVLATQAMMPDRTNLGVIGSGAEAQKQAEALLEVSNISAVRVYSPRPSSRLHFQAALGKVSSVPIIACADPEEVVETSDTIVVATNTKGKEVAFRGEWLESRTGKRTHISSIGSTLPNQLELDELTWSFTNRVVLDSWDVLEESGDALRAQRAGTLDQERVMTLADVYASEPSEAWSGITLYKSIGSAIQDVGLARCIFDAASSNGIGVVMAGLDSVRQL